MIHTFYDNVYYNTVAIIVNSAIKPHNILTLHTIGSGFSTHAYMQALVSIIIMLIL